MAVDGSNGSLVTGVLTTSADGTHTFDVVYHDQTFNFTITTTAPEVLSAASAERSDIGLSTTKVTIDF